MVTAVVIPILCLYFFWFTRKEMKLNDSKWLAAADVAKEAVLTGEIKSINQEKQRFYYHRYILLYELTVQTETKLIKAKKIIPIRNNIEIDTFSVGEVLRIYGSWEGNHFHFNEYQLVHIDKK
ncbi:hypothetical protein MLOOGBEN_24900 [Bacillus sp. EB106-08-02-XG196]|uniref:hypothetical protein n=1 Tax=Bacillus sp. EB106-08-02-XG196 TaxID=2737049 RepID=UPI0015C439B9|nr:hypothetical protein [Bacillus sp. EB106-08-02-XG196]NWQ43946.1 hypothetical protein [Bacillus sp. EB106-08-02-XG196]